MNERISKRIVGEKAGLRGRKTRDRRDYENANETVISFRKGGYVSTVRQNS